MSLPSPQVSALNVLDNASRCTGLLRVVMHPRGVAASKALKPTARVIIGRFVSTDVCSPALITSTVVVSVQERVFRRMYTA